MHVSVHFALLKLLPNWSPHSLSYWILNKNVSQNYYLNLQLLSLEVGWWICFVAKEYTLAANPHRLGQWKWTKNSWLYQIFRWLLNHCHTVLVSLAEIQSLMVMSITLTYGTNFICSQNHPVERVWVEVNSHQSNCVLYRGIASLLCLPGLPWLLTAITRASSTPLYFRLIGWAQITRALAVMSPGPPWCGYATGFIHIGKNHIITMDNS